MTKVYILKPIWVILTFLSTSHGCEKAVTCAFSSVMKWHEVAQTFAVANYVWKKELKGVMVEVANMNYLSIYSQGSHSLLRNCV